MADSKTYILDPSLMSVRIETYCEGAPVARATGFVVVDGPDRPPCLVTNRHVVRGRHDDTDESLDDGRWPTQIHVHWPTISYGTVETRSDLLDSDGLPMWRVHPDLANGLRIDIAALPLQAFPEQIGAIPYDLQADEPPMFVPPSSELFIVGFPLGLTGSGTAYTPGPWAIWTRGTVATQIEFEWDHRPMFLVDCRGRPAMSGSPVLAYSVNGQYTIATAEGPRPAFGVAPCSRFLGVYSGRISEKSDLGIVWTRHALERVVREGHREPQR